MLAFFNDTSYEEEQYSQGSDQHAHIAFDTAWARGVSLSAEILAAHTWLGAVTAVSFSNALNKKMASIESAPMQYGEIWTRANSLVELVDEFTDIFEKMDDESGPEAIAHIGI